MAGPTALTPAPAGGEQPLRFAGVHTQPSFDPVELLPQQAAERLRKLRIRRDDAFAVTIKHAELQSLTVERLQADQRLRQLRAHPHDHGHNLPVTDVRVVAQQKLVDKLTADLARLNERSQTRAVAFQTASAALTACEDWVKHGKPSGVMLQDFDGPEPQLLKGEKGLLDAIENRRRRVRELRADLHRVRSAPFPSSHAKAKCRAEIEALAERGAPVLSDVVEHDRQIIWPLLRVQSEVFAEQRALVVAEVPDMLAVFAWLHRDALLKQVEKAITSEADDAASLSHEERQRREAEVSSDLLDIERQEAALVWRAMDEKLPAEHRHDCSPQAVLQVLLVTVPRAIDGPSTSPLTFDIVQPRR